MKKLAVLVSGGGTNLQAIIDAIADKTITNAEIAVVISNNANAYALERAKKHGIPGICVSPKSYGTRAAFNEALLQTCLLYTSKLLKNGKKTNLPFKSVLTVPVGKKYNGKELTLLHCVDGKIEKLQGKVQDELLSVEVSTLGSIGVVVDTPENIGGSTENTNGNNTTESGQPGSAAKTADETQVEILLMVCIVSSLAVYTILRKKSKKL